MAFVLGREYSGGREANGCLRAHKGVEVDEVCGEFGLGHGGLLRAVGDYGANGVSKGACTSVVDVGSGCAPKV